MPMPPERKPSTYHRQALRERHQGHQVIKREVARMHIAVGDKPTKRPKFSQFADGQQHL